MEITSQPVSTQSPDIYLETSEHDDSSDIGSKNIESEKAKTIAQKVGDKNQEYRTNAAIGNILCNNGNNEKANECHKETLKIAKDVSDKHCEGKSYLHLASVCIKECDYKTAKEWYEKALVIFETEVNDDILKKRTLTGLAIALFNLGNSQKATECIGKAQKNSIAAPSTGKCFSSSM